MPISEEEKRWLIVGISLNKVLAPKLRVCVEKGFLSHYNNLDVKYHGLKTLAHATASSCPDLSKLKFGNINSNSLNHGTKKKNYSYTIKDHVDLAKLYLPDYLAKFTGFDDSLDVSAMLRLLGFSKPPIFPSTSLVCVQAAADGVKDDVRNKWGHCNLAEWTQAFYDDCFASLENLVQSLDLTSVEAKELKYELKEWQSQGWAKCCMGHLDKELLTFIKQSEIINKEFPNLQNKMEEVTKRVQQLEGKLEEHEQKVEGRMEEHEQKVEERMEEHEQKVEGRMEEHEQKVEERMEEHEQKVEGRIEEYEQKVEGRMEEAGGRIEELGQEVCGLRQKFEELELHTNAEGGTNEQQAREGFDLPKFRARLAEFYETTMSQVQRVPWDPDSTLHINDAYLPLSWTREDKQPSGTQEKQLDDYTDIFSCHKNCANPKRIVVEGQGGIGKSTFSQKLAVDWAEGEKEALKKFEILLMVKLRDVRGIRDFRDILFASGILQSKNPAQVKSLLQYIKENPDKVLIFLDGYDEYDRNLAQDATSDVRKIIAGSMFIGCYLVVTTRPQRKDEVKNMHSHCKIKGFTRDGIFKFAFKYIKAEEWQPFTAYVSTHRLLDMAKIPLLLQFLCLLWDERKQEPLPTSKTLLYQEVVQCILDHGHEKLSPGHQKSLEDCSETLCKIGKLAFEALIQDTLVFGVNELPDEVLDDGVCFGFFTTRVQRSRSKKTTSFIHKSVQEFLAAWYIAKEVVPSTCTDWLSSFDNFDRCSSHGFRDFFVYVCGLSTEGAIVFFQHLKSIGLKENLLPSGHDFISLGSLNGGQVNFVESCFELYSIVDCWKPIWQTFLECVNGVVMNRTRFPSVNLFTVYPSVLRELLRHSGSFAFYIEHYIALKSVTSDLNRFDTKVVSTFGIFTLTFSEFTQKCAASGSESFWMLKIGSVFYIGFKYLRGDLPWWTQLYQSSASSSQEQSETEPDGQIENLVTHEQLPFHCLLPTEHVENLHPLSTHFQVLLHESKYASNLQTLRLSRLRVSPKMIDHLVKLLDEVSSLEHLDLSYNPLGPALSVLFCHLRSVPKLRSLNLTETNMTEREAVDLSNVLEHVPLLEWLFLDDNPIGRGAIALANNLRHVPELAFLYLKNTGVDAECRVALERAKENRNTKMLIWY